MKSIPQGPLPVLDSLRVYFRPGRSDHKELNNRLYEGDHRVLGGAVLDPSYERFADDLRRDLRSRGLEAILDTQALELATPAGFARPRLQRLSWAGNQVHRPADLAGGGGLDLVDQLAKHAVANRYSAILSPTHYFTGPEDPWFGVDRHLVKRQRRYLDASGGRDVLIYYLLAVHPDALRDPERRHAILTELADLPIDGVFLRVHNFGQNAGGLALRRYIAACEDLHQLRVPVIADRVGSAGLPLLAFGAVGGITASMTMGEEFDARSLIHPPKDRNGKGFAALRVYIGAIGAYMYRSNAESFFAMENRTRAKFACRERCCPNGFRSMIEEPRRHHFYARLGEVARISDAPTRSARVDLYMNDFLRPASDLANRAAKVDPGLAKTRKTLSSWRDALRILETSKERRSRSRVPKGQRIPSHPPALWHDA